MPFYRVTLAENTRCYHKHDPIEAATPDAAADIARDLGAWTHTEFGDTADAEEPTFFVDECDEDGGRLPNGKTLDLDYPGYVYKAGLEQFARKIAALSQEGAYNDAIETLDDLIREARAMLGMSDAQIQNAGLGAAA